MNVLIEKIDGRITKLQSDWNEYTKPKRFEPTYTPEGHEYHKSIPIRLDELKWILKKCSLTVECMSSGTYTEHFNYATNFNVPLLIHIVVCSSGLN